MRDKMKTFFEDVHVSTKNRTEVVDVTTNNEEIMRRSEITNGLCVIHTVHSTAAVIVNEHEAGLVKDIIKKIQQDFPRKAGWLHDRVDNNADAHLASSYIGRTRILPVREGRLVRGPWQNIFLLELDGPQTRKIMVEIIGE
jgi:secondary thiamine-phosphate synthase enzyme